MLKDVLSPPDPSEYAPYYARYVAMVASADVLALLEQQQAEVAALSTLGSQWADFRYAANKWSVKETIGHMSDTERVFAYRILRFARGDTTPLPGFDQDPYVAAANFDKRPIRELTQEFEAVRAATLALLHSFDPQVLQRQGLASDAAVTVRALIYIMAGHVAHHLQLLQAQYGLTMSVH